MKPTRKARANMCKATLKKHNSLQVRCRSARTAQGGHRSSYWQLISERRGSGGRCDGRGERGGGTARLGLALGHVAGWEAVEGTWQLGFRAASWPFTSCVILGQLLNLSEPPSFTWGNGDNWAYPCELKRDEKMNCT